MNYSFCEFIKLLNISPPKLLKDLQRIEELDLGLSKENNS